MSRSTIPIFSVPRFRAVAPPSPESRSSYEGDGPRVRYWTREEYYRAAALNLFEADERLELIRGEIVEKMPQEPKHFTVIEAAQDILPRAFINVTCCVRAQGPLHLPDDTEPEPDIAVVRGTRHLYQHQHPRADDVLLVIEVANSTLAYDRDTKAPIYAEVGILEYWIVNVRDRVLEVYRDAERTGFTEPVLVLRENDIIAPLAAPDATIAVADLLPDAV